MIQIVAYIPEYGSEHGIRQPPGIGVIARAVIAGKNAQAANVACPVVTEGMSRNRRTKCTNRRLMRNRSQCDDCLQIPKSGQHRQQELSAIVDLGADGLVFRRHAAHRIDDAGIQQAQTVVRTSLELASGKTEFTQCAVEQITGIVAGEGASGSIGAAQTWRQPHNQEPNIVIMRWQKRWNR